MDTIRDQTPDSEINPSVLAITERIARDLRARIAENDVRHTMLTAALGLTLGIASIAGPIIAIYLGFLGPPTLPLMLVGSVVFGVLLVVVSGRSIENGIGDRYLLRKYEKRLAEFHRAGGVS